MRLVALAAIVTAAVVFIAPRPADACTCAYDLEVTPASGATAVPTNVVVVVLNRRAGPGFDDFVLEGPGGEVAVEVVLIDDQYAHRLELVRPLEPLQPLVEYELRTDAVLTVFETGSLADSVAPEPVTLGELTLARANVTDGFADSCGDEYSFVDLQITPPADAVAIDVFVEADDVRSHYVVPADYIDWGLSSWNDGCSLRVPLQAGALTCIEVRARDAAGNLSEQVQRCATVTACADIPDAEAFDGDLGDCEPYVEPEPDPDPPGDSGGCRSTSPTAPAPLLLLAFAYAVLLSARYARKCRIAARADSRSPARS